MIISISGDPGSGKSTVAKILAQRLKLKHYSVGDLRGKMALERGMTIDELNKLGEKDAFTDKDADDYQKELGKKEDNFIIDGRLSFYFIPHSFKIFLRVDENVAAERIFRAPKRPDETQYKNVGKLLDALRNRVESDKKRYKKYYGIDHTDLKQYDLVINTSHLAPEQIIEKIISEVNKKISC